MGTIADNGDGTFTWSLLTDGATESQTVTLTATDSDGAETTTTFELVVENVAPEIAVDQLSVTVNEGSTATLSGTFADLDAVSLAASVGTIADNGDGTFTWSLLTDGATESQTVTLTATDSDGAETTTTFELVVENVAPEIVVNEPSVTVDEGSTATTSGTFADADAVSLTASVGTIVDNGDGTFTWSLPTDGATESQTVTLTATDSDGAETTTIFELVVENVAPEIAVNQPSVTVDEGATATVSGSFADADAVTLTASVGAIFDNGDGTFTWSLLTDGATESQTVTLTATDSDGAETTTTFALTVENVAPEIAVDQPSVTVDEGATATTPGTFCRRGCS